MTRLTDAFWSYFYGPVSRVRVTWLIRILALVFAFDVWFNMLEHGWRYGAEGFNVAHIGWLTQLQPVPDASWYVMLVGIASLTAFGVAVGHFGRGCLGVVAATFSYSWLMSMLDSYQHHYLLSLLLACGVGMPVMAFGADSPEDDAAGEDADDVAFDAIEAWGYPLMCATLTLVYGFAAFAKMEPGWRTGAVLTELFGGESIWMRDLWMGLGGGEASFWWGVGLSAVVTQLFLALVYGLAPVAERRGGKGWHLLRTAGLVAAIGFHASVEILEFNIQWFSYYMLAVALISLGPLAPLRWLDWGFARLRETLLTPIREQLASLEATVVVGFVSGLGVMIALIQLDLPGTTSLAILSSLAVTGTALVSSARGQYATGLRVAVVGMLAGLCAWGSVTYDETRFDFYRYTGGDLQRRLPGAGTTEERRRMLEQALHAYRKAERYSPPDESRRDDIQTIQQKLEILDDSSP